MITFKIYIVQRLMVHIFHHSCAMILNVIGLDQHAESDFKIFKEGRPYKRIIFLYNHLVDTSESDCL